MTTHESAKPSDGPEPRTPRRSDLTVNQYKERMGRRFYKALDYFTIAFTSLFAYGSFFLADYLLLLFIEFVISKELEQSYLLATFFDNVKLGLACVTVTLCLIHGLRAACAQYRLDKALTDD